MSKSWNSGTTYELMMYKFIMWPLGIWPPNRGEIFSEIRLILAATTQAATCICLHLEMWHNCRGAEDFLDIFVLSVFSLLACIKGLIVRYHLNEVDTNVTSAIQDWFNLSSNENPQNNKIMMRHAKIGRIVCISLMAPASGGTLSWIVFALPFAMFAPENNTEPIKNFPLQTPCTFDFATTSNFYYVIFVIQVYQLITTCLGNCGNDVFFFGLAMHVCGQFEILKSEFNSVENKRVGIENGEYFKNIIKRHVHLINLVEKLETTFNMIILTQLIMSAILICIMGLQVIIALNMGDVFSGIKANIVLSSLMSQLFLYSYGGDYLTSQSHAIADAAYESLWYKYSIRTMRDIGFVIFRAEKSVYVTAGKFFYMTLGTFMDILKLSVSYMSVLRVAMDV
ncbi:odorant receptor 22c-like [Chelonus insularis]|uniref:odorant receptor 22c-like n=1 Tax=Chelonus insularis TaxID=460826 RepID=UPI00158C5A61|nr:odorant receptor 22c-like [Chelonus insularis]